uniref:Uncharacterized protein n=1 Tax=Wuchereria bancrofti TaxID=6293 RepID=A0A1I8EQ13_WUCBA
MKETLEFDEKIVYGTDGIFLHETFYDSVLTYYFVVIVDKSHERSVHRDVLLYLVKIPNFIILLHWKLIFTMQYFECREGFIQ